MGCKACSDAWDKNEIYPYRLGNEEIGWGSIGVIACKEHILLAFELFKVESGGRG